MASSSPDRQPTQSLGPLFALIGPDGSGKSTLAVDLTAWLASERPASNVYLGLRSGDAGAFIKRLPIIGRRFEASLSKRASQARDKSKKIPGLATALVIFIFSLLRKRRFERMQALRRKGIVVVTDRYPQTEVPGFYDGPGLAAARAESAAVRWLARMELAMYEHMASHRPDLVIRLNIDLETAMARRPDDNPTLLAAKIAVTPQLRFNAADIAELSALDPYDQVLAGAKRLIRAKLEKIGQPLARSA